jgi:peroxiredoxin
MTSAEPQRPVAPGEPAPDFVLPAVNQDGTVAPSDYRGRTPVLLAMMRGLYCAFCRRHIAQLGTTRQKLQPLGIEVLAIVATPPERARLYYRYRPVGVPLAADPDLVTHRAYGVPQPALTPEITEAVASKYVALARKLEIPSTDQAGIRSVLCRQDGFERAGRAAGPPRLVVALWCPTDRPVSDRSGWYRPLGQHRGGDRGPGGP